MSHDVDELRWVRIMTPLHIPKYLVEQVRDRDYTVEDFYKYHEVNCLIEDENGDKKINPLWHLHILINDKYEVKGFVWCIVDALAKDIVIQTFSVDKEYWYKGKAVSKLSDYIKDIRRKACLNKIYWVTNYPKHSERHGFKRSKGVLMEYQEEKDGQNSIRRNTIRPECRLAISRSEELPERSVRECVSASG